MEGNGIMKKLIYLMVVCSLITGCNTIRGVGEDIKKSAEFVQKTL